jgi:hypothetical protein
MTVTPREWRMLSWTVVSLLLSGPIYFWLTSGTGGTTVVAPTDSAALAEKRLAKLRDAGATVPQKEEILKTISAQLAQRESGLIKADTAAQAGAALLQILTRLCASQQIPIKQPELLPIMPLGSAYGEAVVAVNIECHIDQLINLLADISAQPELLTTTDLQVQAANPKEKTVNVRLAVGGVTSRTLVPTKPGSDKGQKKGAGL